MGHNRSRLLVAALAGLVVGWLAYTELYVPSGARPLAYRTSAIGRLQLPRARVEVFRTRAELEAFLDSLDVATNPPRIDFEREAAVLIALGPRSSAGSSIEIVRVEEQRGRIVVAARERYESGAPAVVSYPSVVVIVRERGKPVVVRWDD